MDVHDEIMKGKNNKAKTKSHFLKNKEEPSPQHTSSQCVAPIFSQC
jgi:hypothetical protein